MDAIHRMLPPRSLRTWERFGPAWRGCIEPRSLVWLMIALRARDTLGYDGKAPGDLPRTAAKETRGRAPAYANACMNSSA